MKDARPVEFRFQPQAGQRYQARRTGCTQRPVSTQENECKASQGNKSSVNLVHGPPADRNSFSSRDDAHISRNYSFGRGQSEDDFEAIPGVSGTKAKVTQSAPSKRRFPGRCFSATSHRLGHSDPELAPPKGDISAPRPYPLLPHRSEFNGNERSQLPYTFWAPSVAEGSSSSADQESLNSLNHLRRPTRHVKNEGRATYKTGGSKESVGEIRNLDTLPSFSVNLDGYGVSPADSAIAINARDHSRRSKGKAKYRDEYPRRVSRDAAVAAWLTSQIQVPPSSATNEAKEQSDEEFHEAQSWLPSESPQLDVVAVDDSWADEVDRIVQDKEEADLIQSGRIFKLKKLEQEEQDLLRAQELELHLQREQEEGDWPIPGQVRQRECVVCGDSKGVFRLCCQTANRKM